MRNRNSAIYSFRDSKSNYKITNSCKDKILKNLFLNNLNKVSQNNIVLIKNLNNTYRNYEKNINQKDSKIANNLFHIGKNRVINMRNKIKYSEKLLRQYEEEYGFNSAINMNKFINANNNSIPSLLSESKAQKEKLKNAIEKYKNNNKKNDVDYIIQEYNKKKNKNHYNRYSVSINYKNSMKKLMKIIINENKIQKKIRKLNQLDTLYSAIETVSKREIVNDNKHFKVENKNRELIPFFKDMKKDKKIFNYNYIRNRFKHRKKKNNICLSEERSINRDNITKFSYIKTNFKNDNKMKTFFNQKKNKNNDDKKIIPQILLSTSNSKSNISNIRNSKDLKIENISDISNIESTCTNRKNINFSSSLPNLNHHSKNVKPKKDINYSLNNIFHIDKKRLNLSARTFQKNNEMKPIIHKAINEGKKINKIIKKNYNYLMHKENKTINNFMDILNEQKIDFNNLRKELKLKDSKGIYGKIDEIEIMENNIKKMERHITKKQINIIKSIAKKIINEEILLNKKLVYNVGVENREQRQKYLDLYNMLTKSRYAKRKRKIKQNFTFQ